MIKFKEWYFRLTIYYKLIPFLLVYLAISILFAPTEFYGDEARYVWFANNLLKGFYSPPFPDINLWNGPGYPLLISVFLFFKLPLIFIRVLNAVLLYLALLISYKSIHVFISERIAFLYVVLLGLYYPVFETLPLIFTESLTWFLISLVVYLLLKNLRQNSLNFKLLLLTSATIAYLAMVKVIFGYVIPLTIIASIFLIIFPKYRKDAKKSVVIFFFAILFCFPYLFFTYSLTGKLYYWANSASMSLYTMSTPNINESGDWLPKAKLKLNPNHSTFMDSISRLKPLQMDEAFKKTAIKNIINNPLKYFSNWVANVGRLLFSYPYSSTQQSTSSYFTILPNMFVVVFILIAFMLCILRYKYIPPEIVIILIFILIYLFGSSLLSSYRRMFYVTLPFWAVFISFVFNNTISIIKENKSDSNI